MNDTMAEALNDQLRQEFQAAFLYLAFSVNLHEHGMHGAGHWMREQYREECGHAFKILDYLETRDAPVHIPPVEAPDYIWEHPIDLFELALGHEQRITASIHTLLTLSRHEGDVATELMLHDFVAEQVEEESTLRRILQDLHLCCGQMAALLQVDERLGRRGK